MERSGYSKTRISELLRGNGYHPAWEITFSVTRALGLPTRPLRRLWAAAAREAGKGDDGIRHGIRQVAHDGEEAPLPYQAFTDDVEGIYTDYARAFLLTDQRARWVVSEAFDILWVCWDGATASDNIHRYAWRLLRSRVMTRAPRHHDGRPDLRAAVFSTREIHGHSAVPGHLVVLTELIDLERQTSVFLNITERLVKGVIRQSSPKHLAAAAVVAGAVAGRCTGGSRSTHESPAAAAGVAGDAGARVEADGRTRRAAHPR
ncbi:hypothetical protein [Streptomyces sp. NPDC058335]|uniref:hypothetical protein n=1 Tax=Streptomyces sp. NPDC058335 TaxID=3346451 RepID=UPI00365F38EA